MSFTVDGKVLTEEEFKKLQSDPNIKLVLVESSSNTYTTLQRMHG